MMVKVVMMVLLISQIVMIMMQMHPQKIVLGFAEAMRLMMFAECAVEMVLRVLALRSM